MTKLILLAVAGVVAAIGCGISAETRLRVCVDSLNRYQPQKFCANVNPRPVYPIDGTSWRYLGPNVSEPLRGAVVSGSIAPERHFIYRTPDY